MEKVFAPSGIENIRQILPYYQPGENIKHGVGAKPYAVRYYITAPNREELDSITERLFNEYGIVFESKRTHDGRLVTLTLKHSPA